MNVELQQPAPVTLYYFFKLTHVYYGEQINLLVHCNGMLETLDTARNRIVGTDMMPFNGEDYKYIGVAVQGIKLSDGAKVNSPTLTVSNNINNVPNYMSRLCAMYDYFRGAKLQIFIMTERAYKANTGQYIEQIWYIERPTAENFQSIQFELSSPLDFRRQQVPTRIVAPFCTWAMRGDYRGEECGYTGTKYFDRNGNPVSDISQDECGGKCSDCELRFGQGSRLPFGGQLVTYSNGNS